MVWKLVSEMPVLDARLRQIGTSGYSLVIHLRGLAPEHYVSTFPEPWLSQYRDRQFALLDPVNHWARTNTGRMRWSDLEPSSITAAGAQVMESAKRHGLCYGGGASRHDPGRPALLSFLFCAREDRELTDSELEEVEHILGHILTRIGASRELSGSELDMIDDMALGLSYKQIARKRGISPETVKKRLERARMILGAKNSVQAVAIATRRGLILNRPDRGPKGRRSRD